MLDDISRWGSRLEFSATTEKTTSPGERYFSPSLRETSLQLGGKIEETRTRFCEAMPASRSANSKEVRRSLCFPTPLVRKIRFGTMLLPTALASLESPLMMGELKNLTQRKACAEKMLHCWSAMNGALLFGNCLQLYRLQLDGDINKGQRGTAESFVLAEDKCE